jgi:hypothetical protein
LAGAENDPQIEKGLIGRRFRLGAQKNGGG